MGDVAMAAPVLAEVARKYPGVGIVMLTRDLFAPFFDQIPNLTVHSIDFAQKHKGKRGLWRLFKELRKVYPDVERVIDLHDKIYSKVLRGFFRMAGIRTYHINKGRAEKKALTRRHHKIRRPLRTTVERYADVFRQAGLNLNKVPDSLDFYRVARPVPGSLGLEKKIGELWLGIAPFAQHKGKIYPFEKMEEVIGLLLKRFPSLRIFLFGGGETEKMQAGIWHDKWPEHVTSVIGKLDLRQEMNLMGNLDLMISMDSSSMHMASLVGLRVVSVWGATHPDAGFLGLGQVRKDAVGVDPAELTCRPCSVYGNKPCWHKPESDLYYACLAHLLPDRIVDRVAVYLDK